MKKTLTVKIEVETDHSGFDDEYIAMEMRDKLNEIATIVYKDKAAEGDHYESSGVLCEDGIQQQYWYTITEQ